jgi:hypothetical protein
MSNVYLEKIAGMLDAVKGAGKGLMSDIKRNPKTYAAVGVGAGIAGGISQHMTNKRLQKKGLPNTAGNRVKDQLTHII